MEGVLCSFCQIAAKRAPLNFATWEYHCNTCGKFRITKQALKRAEKLHGSERSRASAFTRARQIRAQPVPLIADESEAEGDAVTLRDVLAAFPTSVQDRFDRTMLNLAKLSPKLGKRFSLHVEKDYPVTYAEDGPVAIFLLKELHDAGLIALIGRPGQPDIGLTGKGWQRIAELERQQPNSTSRQAFVAMSFGFDRRAECEAGITMGVDAAGYDPFIVDRKEYLGKIDDRIVAEIRKSRFLLADLSLQRPNFYFEAGFAEGIGLPVIYTCVKDELGEVHFDKRQENIIDWETQPELAERLHRRIEAVIGRPST